MNCRAKTLIEILMQLRVSNLIFGLLFSFQIHICSANSNETKDLENLTAYPHWVLDQIKQSKGWSPNYDVSPQCKLSFSSDLSTHLDPQKCESKIELSVWQNFISKLFVDFKNLQLDDFEKVIFSPHKNLKFRGLLYLQKKQSSPKGEPKQRPLVILRMGIHGNIDEFLAERFLARILIEELGYHVLILESLTSHGFLKLNEQVTFGGLEEGLHTFYILQLLRAKKLPWAKWVTDKYLLGISLGGHGVFLTNYLDENSKVSEKPDPQLKSIELFCPVVNLEETFKAHSASSLKSILIDFWNWRRLIALREKNPDIQKIEIWKSLFDFKPRFMPAVIDMMNQKNSKPLIDLKIFKTQFPDLELPENFIEHLEKSKTLFELNSFWSLIKSKRTPLTLFYTPNDPAVINSLNIDLLIKRLQPGSLENIEFVQLKGVHCSVAAEYQWPFLIELIKSKFESKK